MVFCVVHPGEHGENEGGRFSCATLALRDNVLWRVGKQGREGCFLVENVDCEMTSQTRTGTRYRPTWILLGALKPMP